MPHHSCLCGSFCENVFHEIFEIVVFIQYMVYNIKIAKNNCASFFTIVLYHNHDVVVTQYILLTTA